MTPFGIEHECDFSQLPVDDIPFTVRLGVRALMFKTGRAEFAVEPFPALLLGLLMHRVRTPGMHGFPRFKFNYGQTFPVFCRKIFYRDEAWNRPRQSINSSSRFLVVRQVFKVQAAPEDRRYHSANTYRRSSAS